MRTPVLALLGLVLLAPITVLPAQSASSGGTAPIGAYTVVGELPGMGRPVDTASVAARRRALLRRIGRGTVLIPAAHERNIEQEYVQDNDFRQDNTFFYFTELETQDAWLLLTARGPDSLETVLFLPPRTPSRERWTGLRLGPDSVAVRLSGIQTILPVDSMEAPWKRGPGPKPEDPAFRGKPAPDRERRSHRHGCRRGMGSVHRRCHAHDSRERALLTAAKSDLRPRARRPAGGIRFAASGRHDAAARWHRASLHARSFRQAVRRQNMRRCRGLQLRPRASYRHGCARRRHQSATRARDGRDARTGNLSPGGKTRCADRR